LDSRKVEGVNSFLQQAPFTGTYSAQSGEVVGILKDMKDTFTRNLNQAVIQEEAAVEAHKKYMEAMKEALDAMMTSQAEKQGDLAANDASLSDKKQKLKSAETTKADAEKFLATLQDMCSVKAKEYDDRTMLRAQEQAAIAEAIAILNSDAAFATFGTVKATSKVAFVQLQAIQVHSSEQDVRTQTARNLRQSKAWKTSIFLAKVAALLQAENPFEVVIKEINKMLELLKKEEEADDEQLDWCNTERDENEKNLATKKGQISQLEATISKLTNDIEDPATGLKFLISEDERKLVENDENQKTQTASRTEDNLAYQKNIANLVEAETLLARAIKVLNAYYSTIIAGKDSFLATNKRQPTPPDTWKEGGFEGQSKSGTDAITMIKHILDETKQEEAQAHTDEMTAQHAYEDEMAVLTKEETDLQDSLAKLNVDLAETEEKLLMNKKDHETTVAEKEAIEAYLLKIKPGCDFITDNIQLRKTNRKDEEAALEGAVKLLEGSPAYKTWEAEHHNETLGDCLSICAPDEEDVKCKACLAKVSIPGYCAGHPGTKGC